MKMTIKGGNKNKQKKSYVHITYINTIFKILPRYFEKHQPFSPFRVPKSSCENNSDNSPTSHKHHI